MVSKHRKISFTQQWRIVGIRNLRMAGSDFLAANSMVEAGNG